MLVDPCSGGVLRISVSSVHVTDHSQGMISVSAQHGSFQRDDLRHSRWSTTTGNDNHALPRQNMYVYIHIFYFYLCIYAALKARNGPVEWRHDMALKNVAMTWPQRCQFHGPESVPLPRGFRYNAVHKYLLSVFCTILRCYEMYLLYLRPCSLACDHYLRGCFVLIVHRTERCICLYLWYIRYNVCLFHCVLLTYCWHFADIPGLCYAWACTTNRTLQGYTCGLAIDHAMLYVNSTPKPSVPCICNAEVNAKGALPTNLVEWTRNSWVDIYGHQVFCL